MNVVDSSGWLEYLGNLSNANFFEPAVQDVENLLVPTVVVYEVFKRLVQISNPEAAREAVGIMSDGLIVDWDASLALEAAEISIQNKLPMADSMILATARHFEATLWTQDAHFRDLPGVKFVEKP
jgi:predicted nucleic acid-binding protein